MRSVAISALVLQCVFCANPAVTQQPRGHAPSAASPEFTFKSSSNLVLVDVIALKNGVPEKTLQPDEFQILDDGRPVPIKTFDTGTRTRPLALWFIVQCRMEDWEAEGSAFFVGHTTLFKPVLEELGPRDTIAVAHWCDDGQSELDLLPARNAEQAVSVLEQVLTPVHEPIDHARTGELALQKTLQLITDATSSSTSDSLAVAVFLYDDYSGMPRSEADHFIEALLETSAIVFGLKDTRSPHQWWLPGEQKEVARYIATQTGGHYLSVSPNAYADGLKLILQELQSRYELGFQPQALDGKQHKLTVKLRNNKSKRIQLRYRSGYVPVLR